MWWTDSIFYPLYLFSRAMSTLLIVLVGWGGCRFEDGLPRRGNTFVSESRRSIDFCRVGWGMRPDANSQKDQSCIQTARNSVLSIRFTQISKAWVVFVRFGRNDLKRRRSIDLILVVCHIACTLTLIPIGRSERMTIFVRMTMTMIVYHWLITTWQKLCLYVVEWRCVW